MFDSSDLINNPKFRIGILLLVLILVNINLHWGKNNWQVSLNSDGKGYYAYLPSFLVHNDFQFTTIDTSSNPLISKNINPEFRIAVDNKRINKYTVGVAFCMMPFFLVAHSVSLLMNLPTDGYSYLYFISINLASVFFTVLGLYATDKLLRGYNFSGGLIFLVLTAILFGSQLFCYSVAEPSMSHSYSFGLISIFFYQSRQFFIHPTKSAWFKAILLLAIVVLIRPINLLCILFLPFLSGDTIQLKAAVRYLKKNAIVFLLSLLSFFIIVSIQLIIYKLQSGSYFVDTYPGEHFNWTNPHPLDLLFSYKKGLFLYTPIFLFSSIGFVSIYRINRYACVTLICALLLQVYIFSSWWNWWYGYSFSSRPMTEYLSIVAILLSFGIDGIRSFGLKQVSKALVLCLILFTQIQIYQYRHFIIHPEKMDKTHYQRVFMRVDQLFANENANSDLLDEK
ncbi:MAG: hypothetical protein U0073_12290 [Bacteroidia bacterium]